MSLRPFLLAAHSPSTAFDTRPTKAWHRVPGPAAVEVPRLVCCVAVRVTWLEAYASGRVSFARGSRRGDVCTNRVARDFGRQKPEAPPYPSTPAVRGVAPSPAQLTGKPLRAVHG